MRSVSFYPMCISVSCLVLFQLKGSETLINLGIRCKNAATLFWFLCCTHSKASNACKEWRDVPRSTMARSELDRFSEVWSPMSAVFLPFSAFQGIRIDSGDFWPPIPRLEGAGRDLLKIITEFPHLHLTRCHLKQACVSTWVKEGHPRMCTLQTAFARQLCRHVSRTDG